MLFKLKIHTLLYSTKRLPNPHRHPYNNNVCFWRSQGICQEKFGGGNIVTLEVMKIQILEHLIVELGDIYDDYFEIKKRMAEEK